MWIKHGEVLCARTAAQFLKITSLCPRSSLSRAVEEFHLLLDSLSLLMVRMSDIFTTGLDSHEREMLFIFSRLNSLISKQKAKIIF